MIPSAPASPVVRAGDQASGHNEGPPFGKMPTSALDPSGASAGRPMSSFPPWRSSRWSAFGHSNSTRHAGDNERAAGGNRSIGLPGDIPEVCPDVHSTQSWPAPPPPACASGRCARRRSISAVDCRANVVDVEVRVELEDVGQQTAPRVRRLCSDAGVRALGRSSAPVRLHDFGGIAPSSPRASPQEEPRAPPSGACAATAADAGRRSWLSFRSAGDPHGSIVS